MLSTDHRDIQALQYFIHLLKLAQAKWEAKPRLSCYCAPVLLVFKIVKSPTPPHPKLFISPKGPSLQFSKPVDFVLYELRPHFSLYCFTSSSCLQSTHQSFDETNSSIGYIVVSANHLSSIIVQIWSTQKHSGTILIRQRFIFSFAELKSKMIALRLKKYLGD